MQFFSVNSENDYVDVDLYEQRLNEVGHIYVDLVGLGIYAQSESCLAQAYHRLCLKFMNLHSKVGYSGLNSDSLIHYLTSVEGIPFSSFKRGKVQGQSIDKTKVLEPLRMNGYAPDFFDLYFTYINHKARHEGTMSVFKRNIGKETVLGWDGGELYKVPFTAKVQVNLRFNYSGEDIIGFPREVKSLIQAPKGYVLVWGDFAQSDARIAFNTLLKDDYTLPLVEKFPDDIYAGFANLASDHTYRELQSRLESAKRYSKGYKEDTGLTMDDYNVRSIEEELEKFEHFSGFKDKKERELYKLRSLRTMYGTRHDPVKSNSEFINKFAAVLNACPKYKRFWNDIERRSIFGVPLKVKCYMGHVEQVAAFDGRRLNETLFKCLNYPVQGGTSEMMILLVNRLLDQFYSLGYSSDDVRVYFARHDEPIFIIKEDVMRDSWIFKDFEILQVDDWIPLKMNFSFGKVYSVEDSDLMDRYHASYNENSSRLHMDIRPSASVDYYPLPNLLSLGANVLSVEDDLKIVTLYDPASNTADVRSVKSDLSVEQVLFKTVEKFVEAVADAGYKQLVIENSVLYNHVEESGDAMVTRIYRGISGPATFKANVISLSAYAKLKGIEPEQVVVDNMEFLKTVKSLNLFKGM